MADIPAIYASALFSEKEMRRRLPKEIYKRLQGCIQSGQELDMDLANAVACAMKEWAVEHGATHYTHWFQPLTGTTAEKHDAFITPQGDGTVILELRGKALTRGEPDASSFPSGGIRATFEARGYTMWDVTSPAFLYDNGGTRTLCIPTAFCSYNGDSLDEKTPLLRAMEAVSREALRVVRLLGDDQSQSVSPYVGAEQEYFIVDESVYRRRKDLIFTGRTLFGARPPKGQEMEDHYFGSIKERVAAFMQEIDQELWRLGVPAKTEHNETAPAQHELASVHTTANVASDQNMLVMNVLKKVARRHHLVCLLHEKPFAGVNGSGKHDNWSLMTDTGRNLLDPGKAPQHNLEFLLFLTAVLRAVDENAGLLRLSAATPGNDLRLCGDEAPPAILSVFLGDQLTAVVEHILQDSQGHVPGAEPMNLGVSTLPHIQRDGTDRNRTSPFAFTGNKFEFRMVPASSCIADANTALCTIVADALADYADELEATGATPEAVRALIRRELSAHQRIIFNGNGYTDAWIAEAARRGLPNIRTMVDAIPEYTTPATVALFERHGVYTARELAARADIAWALYAKTINIEALTMIDMAGREILPAAMRYAGELANAAAQMRALGVDDTCATENLERIAILLRQANSALDALREAQEQTARLSGPERARACRDVLLPAMTILRAPVDLLEMRCDATYWPLPGYGELLFGV